VIKVTVQRTRTQIQRHVYEFPDEEAGTAIDQALAQDLRASEDPYTGRTPWTYTTSIVKVRN
jgi:hypothetical protein